MLKNADGWNLVAAFVALTMLRKRWPIVAAIQHPMPNLAIPPVFTISNPAMEEEDDRDWSTSDTYGIH